MIIINGNVAGSSAGKYPMNNSLLFHFTSIFRKELKEYRQLFNMFDTDGSGAIGNEELKQAMISIGLHANKAEIDNVIKEVRFLYSISSIFSIFFYFASAFFHFITPLSFFQENETAGSAHSPLSLFLEKNCGWHYIWLARHPTFCLLSILLPIHSYSSNQKMSGSGPSSSSSHNHKYQQVDADGNGEIDFEEFCACMKKSQNIVKSTNEELIRECFEIFDQDRNGIITENEFKVQ